MPTPFEVDATVTGTASNDPTPKKLREAMVTVAAAAARIRFDGTRIVKGGKHNVHETVGLFRQLPQMIPGQALLLWVQPPAGLPAAETAQALAARIASLSAAVAATRALKPEQYKVRAAEPPVS